MSRAPDRNEATRRRVAPPTRPLVVVGTDPVVAAQLHDLVSAVAARAAAPSAPLVLAATGPDDTLVDRARWNEVLVLAALRDPLAGALATCRRDGSSASEAIDRAEQHVGTVEALAPHVVAIDVRARLGPDLAALRRALAGEGVRVPRAELLRSWCRWGARPAPPARLDRALHGRLVVGVRGHHLDERVAALRRRLGVPR